MNLNTYTFEYYPTANKAASFNMEAFDLIRVIGYSIGVDISNASGLQCEMYIESSVDKWDKSARTPSAWAEIPESRVVVKADNIVNYNVSECFYAQFRLVVEIKAGSASFRSAVVTKTN